MYCHSFDVGPLTPIALDRLVDLASADLVLDHGEGSGAVRTHLVHAPALGIENEERVVEEVLGDGELRRLAVEAHRVVVELLERVRVPQFGRFLGIALGVLLARVVLLEDEALEEAEHGGAGLGVEHVLQVPHHVVGREFAAVMPLHVLAQVERPALEVVACLPLLAERGARHVVDPGDREIVVDEARGVRGFDPAVGVRALEVLAAHADADHPTLGHVGLRRGGGREIAARELPREGIGCGRGHAEQGGAAQELAAVDPALGQLLLQDGNVGVFAVVTHGILP